VSLPPSPCGRRIKQLVGSSASGITDERGSLEELPSRPAAADRTLNQFAELLANN